MVVNGSLLVFVLSLDFRLEALEVDDESIRTYNAKDTKKTEGRNRGRYYVRYCWTW